MSYSIHHKIQDFLSAKHHLNFVGGVSQESVSQNLIKVLNPATEEVLGTVFDSTREDCETTLNSAQKGLEIWRKNTPAEKELYLLRFADIIEKNTDAIADLLVLEQGKLLKDAKGEVSACVSCFRYFAGWATKIEGNTLDVSLKAPNTEFFAYTKREPVGVVAAITPWNVPVMMFGWKVAPALACGCSVVLKPSEYTPLTALFLAKLSTEIGLPEGVLNVINGYGNTVGEYFVKSPKVNKISFTGSAFVGKIIQQNAAENLSRVTLELGGKNPVIVMESADLTKAKAGISRGVLYNQGQVCVSGSRLYVHKKHFENTLADIASTLNATKVSHGFDPEAGIGPLVSDNHFKKVLNYLNDTKNEGLSALAGGKKAHEKGYFVQPTLYANTEKKSLRIVEEEIFGPVLVAMPFEDINEVIAEANKTKYGLSASIWSENMSEVQTLISKIQAGVIFVNSPVRSDNNMPLGGFKQSGIGRELGKSAIEQYTELKSVCIAY